MATMKTLNGYGSNATELNGKAASDYLQKTDTAANSAKLGGKSPEYYIQPRNLLDNSDFRNPVNQRGATRYTTAHSYGIDRWKVGDVGNMWLTTDGPDEKNLTYTGTGDINISYIYQRFPTTLKAGRTYTLATEFYFNNGLVALSSRANDLGEVEVSTTADPSGILVLTFTPSADYTAEDNNTYIRIQASNTVGLRWAALYEGSYTADTLPPYVPKGYAAELAECQRYYRRGMQGVTMGTQYSNSGSLFSLSVPRMRIKPTTTLTDIFSQGWGNVAASNYTAGWTDNFGSSFYVNYISSVSDDVGKTVAVVYEMSADL